MATVRQNRLLQHLQSGLPEQGEATNDGRLLDCYIARRDEASFAAIVKRHGPMVWGVCCRMLGYQDAEDAFQATFLVLVRRAPSVVPRHMIGNWLYGVAHQTALKARAIAARKMARERQVIDMPEREAQTNDEWTDLLPVLDQELSRLPPRYRAVILLCDLEGRTRKEAAQTLKVPEGSVGGWLARARTMLAKRLSRRGVTLSGVSLATVLIQLGIPKVPAAVVHSTINAATNFAAGPIAAGAVSAPVINLTEGVLKAMLLKKLKVALMVVVAIAIVGTSVTGLAFHATAGEEPTGKPGKDIKPGKLTNQPTAADAELRQLRAEVDRLRADVDELKKRLAAGSKPGAAASDEKPGKLSLKVYPIKDLITSEDGANSLIQIITNVVEPTSWNLQGGPATVEYFPAGKSLVVNQTADVHKQLVSLLDELRVAKAAGDEERKK